MNLSTTQEAVLSFSFLRSRLDRRKTHSCRCMEYVCIVRVLTDLEKDRQETWPWKSPNPMTAIVARETEFQTRMWGRLSLESCPATWPVATSILLGWMAILKNKKHELIHLWWRPRQAKLRQLRHIKQEINEWFKIKVKIWNFTIWRHRCAPGNAFDFAHRRCTGRPRQRQNTAFRPLEGDTSLTCNLFLGTHNCHTTGRVKEKWYCGMPNLKLVVEMENQFKKISKVPTKKVSHSTIFGQDF